MSDSSAGLPVGGGALDLLLSPPWKTGPKSLGATDRVLEPGRAAAVAGQERGRELVRDRGATLLSPHAAREQVLRLLEDLGFAPEVAPERPAEVRLTRCPLLEAAHRHPEVVCALHLGIVRGALTEHGADPSGSWLVPFAEPGACRLGVPPLDEGSEVPVRRA